jgi:hypothetical protein
MIKIDGDFKFADLKGEVSDQAMHAGEYLANVLAADDSQKNNAVKFHSWAMSLYKREVLEIDKQDADMLQKFVDGVEKVPATVRAQLKTVLSAAIDKGTPKKEEKKK